MLFYDLVMVLRELEGLSSNLAMQERLSKLFKKAKSNEIDKICYILIGKVGSEFNSKKFGIAEKMIVKALSKAVGNKQIEVSQLYKSKGDLGLAAEDLINRKGKKFSVNSIFEDLLKLVMYSGSGSNESKINHLVNVFRELSGLESRYFIRILLNKMRLGLSYMTIFVSLAIAFTKDKKNKEIIEKAFNKHPDIGYVAKEVAKNGLDGLSEFKEEVGRPIKMMLAQRVKKIEDLVKKMEGGAGIEEKYDGERIQIHRKGKQIVFFSRRMENITGQFPDLVESVSRIKGSDFILEGEIVPVDKRGKILEFQILMQRRRKYKIEEYIKKVPVCIYLFDILRYGKSLMKEPYIKRHKKLVSIVKENNKVKIVRGINTNKIGKVESFFKKALSRNCEGIIAKENNSKYYAGTRGWSWIKWKKEYIEGMQDTFDLVVVGGYFGRGRWANKYGALLLACYNKKSKKLETVCKVGSGFSDKVLSELNKRLEKYKIENPWKGLKVGVKADVWFKPILVIEVLGAQVTKSPTYSSGYAIRFPRFLRFRDDKKARVATSLKEIARL